MTWVRIDDTFPEHPKVLEVGGDAAWLHVCALAYCNRQLTDGLIHRNVIPRLSDRKAALKLADRLVAAGIWDRAGDDYQIHDYLEYNPSRVQVETLRVARSAAKAAAGKIGGVASGKARSRNEAETKQTGSTSEANTQAETNQIEAPTRPDPTRPVRIQVSRQTDSVDTAEWSVGRQAVALYANAQQPGPGVRDIVKWRTGIEQNQHDEHGLEIGQYIAGKPEATPEQVAYHVLGVARYKHEHSEAWYADPHCEEDGCGGSGNRRVSDVGAGVFAPCPCRSPEPHLATVTPIREVAV